MRFYLGTHQPSWLGRAGVPLFVSHRRLARQRSHPFRALEGWALDSGGFTELSMHGGWVTTPAEYVRAVRYYAEEIGGLEWAAPQDWMCEPPMLARTHRTVADHQKLTTANLLELRSLASEAAFIPVLQGWEPDDYLRHVDAYEAAGVDLEAEAVVGVGSVCRRQDTAEIAYLFERLHRLGLALHGFGVKFFGVTAGWGFLASADSMAWSYNARRHPPLPGCTHRSCSNCLRWALRWRSRLLEGLTWQERLPF